MDKLKHLPQKELYKLVQAYDQYIQEANDENRYSEGWYPVCIEEFYSNDYQDLVKREYITLNKKVIITDPCYMLRDSANWTQLVLHVMPGEYECFLDTYNHEDAFYNAAITIIHKDYADNFNLEEEEEGYIAVDSGQAGFFDYEYYKENKSPSTPCKQEEAFYEKCCQATLKGLYADTIDDKGFVSSSGFGDGMYKVSTIREMEDDNIVGIRLVFITDDEGEDN